MDDRKPMELVRIPAEERVFDREEVLGRDVASVFPTKAAKADLENRAQVFKALFGDDKRFVTESELREIQEATQRRDGADADDGPQKPLAEILREAKEKKEQAFQEGWREMKTGKNRPLTEDELQFFDTLAEAEALKRRRENEEEAAELDAFRRAREQEQARAGEPPSGRQDDGVMGPAVAPTAPLLSLQKEPSRPAVKRRKALAAVVRAAPKAAAASHTGQDPDDSDPAPTLGGLLGGYSSSSEDEA